MSTLRRRLTLTTGVLVAAQVACTTLASVSWWRVLDACRAQQVIGVERERLLDLATASREVYVHQAHTFIEGGDGHIDHMRDNQAAVHRALVAVEVAALLHPERMGGIRSAIYGSEAWFAAEVVPLVVGVGLDRATATALHGVAEGHAASVQAAIGASVEALAADEAAVVERVRLETARAWEAASALLVLGAVFAWVVSGRTARAVSEPIDRLRHVVAALGAGETARAPENGDREFAELGRAFNEMVARVRRAEERRMERERLSALGEIAAAVAHEVMSPIAAILGSAREVPVNAERILGEAAYAQRVIQGLLGFARPGEGPPVALELGLLAEQAVDRAVPFADARGTVVTWSGGPPISLLATPTAARQVLDNLIRNAVETGTDVEVRAVGGGIEVLDRGAGLAPEVRARLYEPFVTTKPDGTGLGLAVSARLVRALGGRLTHVPRDGGGTIARWQVGDG